MLGAGALALAVGLLGPRGYGLATLLVLAWAVFIWLDSSSLTAGAAGSAEPARRGATLAVHSMLGYLGGFVGPFAVGWMLDLAGGMSQLGWALAFGLVALIVVAGFWLHRRLGTAAAAGRSRLGGLFLDLFLAGQLEASAAGALGGVHGAVGIRDQAIHVRAVGRIACDADADADLAGLPGHDHRRFERLHHAPGDDRRHPRGSRCAPE